MNRKLISIGVFSLALSACLGSSDPKPSSVAVKTSKTIEEQGSPKVVPKSSPIAKTEKLLLFQIYGELAPDGYVDGANPITEKYGFRVERVAGCEVSSFESRSVDRNNRKSLAAMDKKFGNDWRKKFTNETKLNLAFPF